MVTYTLTRKAVKNINLRVKRDGSIFVSAPYHTRQSSIDAFVQSKQTWIQSVQKRFLNAPSKMSFDVSRVTNTMCQERFAPVLKRTLLLLGQQRPVSLRIRTCTSRWGSCQQQKRSIMLNRVLYLVPQNLLEYVVLHECVHLLIANHGDEFHAMMKAYMPDYRSRRYALRQFAASGGQ